jgi:hypothetical protein
VEEAPFLMPVQRVVSGIQIEDDLRRRTPLGREKQIDERRFDRQRVVADLVIRRRLRLTQFEPVEGRFAGDRRAVLALRRQLAGQHRHDRVVAQRVVIDHILVAQRDPENTLADHCRYRVLD